MCKNQTSKLKVAFSEGEGDLEMKPKSKASLRLDCTWQAWTTKELRVSAQGGEESRGVLTGKSVGEAQPPGTSAPQPLLPQEGGQTGPLANTRATGLVLLWVG